MQIFDIIRKTHLNHFQSGITESTWTSELAMPTLSCCLITTGVVVVVALLLYSDVFYVLCRL